MAKEQTDDERKEQIKKNTSETAKRLGVKKKVNRQDANPAPGRPAKENPEE
ncbi:MAG TPA: hypothetical protein VGL89_04990 [Candidatus Koribacter sp.]|jgi:hypothetical protein